MSTKKLIPLLLLWSAVLHAQQTFTICHYKPVITFFENGVPKGNITPNFTIKATTDIELSKEAFAYVKPTGKKEVQILEGGKRYSFLDIKNKFEKKEGLLTTVLRFLGIEMTKKEEALKQYAEKNMKDVHAGTPRDASERRQLPPNGTVLLNSRVNFKLKESFSGKRNYNLSVFKMKNGAALVLTDTLLNAELACNISAGNSGDTIYWKCTRDASEAEYQMPYYFVVLPEAVSSKIKKEEQKIQKAKYASEDEKLLALAFFYQEQNLFYEADVAYKELSTTFNSQDYKDLYTLFLAEWSVFRE